MAQNFIEVDGSKDFCCAGCSGLVAGDHLAWFVIDAVANMDLAGFYAAIADGHVGGL